MIVQDLTFVNKTTGKWAFQVFNPATLILENLTGCLMWFTIKTSPADEDPGVLQKTIIGGGIIVDSAINGQAHILLTETDLVDIRSSKTMYYDLKIKTSGGEFYPVAMGTFNVRPGITRATA
jgi:hypothetical protein